MFQELQDFVSTTDPLWQWLSVMLASAIPFIESYFGSMLGIFAGVQPAVAIIAAIMGNIASMILLVLFGGNIRKWRKTDQKPISRRTEKMKKIFNKYGVIGVSLLGQTVLPSQITSMAMVTFGAPKGKVIFWQIISIVIWGVSFGLLALAGINLLMPVS